MRKFYIPANKIHVFARGIYVFAEDIHVFARSTQDQYNVICMPARCIWMLENGSIFNDNDIRITNCGMEIKESK